MTLIEKQVDESPGFKPTAHKGWRIWPDNQPDRPALLQESLSPHAGAVHEKQGADRQRAPAPPYKHRHRFYRERNELA
jgi:hypothetical protein